MKLIGAGLPRTATTTQLIALEQLGLPCYDLNVRMCWVTGAPFAGAYAERQQLTDAAAAWDAEVKATVTADRLIVWEPKDGWEPICAALDLPVPDEPLPNVNDTAGFKAGIIGGALDAVHGWYEVAYGEQGAHGFEDPEARHA
jgi:hypothetical protein